MGCDIHAIIEYKSNDFDLPFDAFTKGEIRIPRDYKLFSAIALGEGGITEDLPYQIRGFPQNCSYQVRNLFFDDVDEVKRIMTLGDKEFVWSEENLEAYDREVGKIVREEYFPHNRLPNFDFYGASWLNANELHEALKKGKVNIKELSAEFRFVLKTMQILSEQYGVENVRLVFWFDGAG